MSTGIIAILLWVITVVGFIFNHEYSNIVDVQYSPRVWEHYHVIIYPGTKNIRFGKNGIFGTQKSFVTTANIQTFKTWPVSVLGLGKKTDNAGDPQFTCYLDDFRVYNKEITQDDLTAIYNMTVV